MGDSVKLNVQVAGKYTRLMGACGDIMVEARHNFGIDPWGKIPIALPLLVKSTILACRTRRHFPVCFSLGLSHVCCTRPLELLQI
jgi:hypothetical protein